MTQKQLLDLIDHVERESSNTGSYLHGPRHWRCVASVGITIARYTDGADPLTAFLFALFHDSMRVNDGDDPGHGARGAELARELLNTGEYLVSKATLERVVLACTSHTGGRPTRDVHIGVCYDADRLNLWRVGMKPDVRYLSTEAGKRMALTSSTRYIHGKAYGWPTVVDNLLAPRATQPFN